MDHGANKIDIASAVEKKFNVTVVECAHLAHKGKTKTQMTRKGRFAGSTSEWKKAIVRLKDGDKIEFFQNV